MSQNKKQNNLIDRNFIREKIETLIEKTDVEYTQENLDKLTELVILLDKWNKSLNLTAIRDPEKIVVLHIMDSAVISPLIKDKGDNIADVGTGAGFPGLVLAILNPDKKFTLIDSVAKKLSFVRTAIVSLKIENVSIINERCENIKLDKKFDCILSRAFAPLSKIAEWCKDLIDNNGIFICMKANLEDEEVSSLPEYSRIEKIIDLNVPTLDAKRIAVFMKAS